jgi:hypothetical protein
MQRQQVRAMVWPILEFDSSNNPNVHLSLANKGVGPAIIRHVVVKVDGQPVGDWGDALDKLVGPEKPGDPANPRLSESDMSGRVLAAGETITVLTPRNREGNPIVFDKSNPLYVQMDKDRARIAVEICYSSTLGDCWLLRGGGTTPNVTTSVGSCPDPSATSFQQ